jgi:hypothetical protein
MDKLLCDLLIHQLGNSLAQFLVIINIKKNLLLAHPAHPVLNPGTSKHILLSTFTHRTWLTKDNKFNYDR